VGRSGSLRRSEGGRPHSSRRFGHAALVALIISLITSCAAAEEESGTAGATTVPSTARTTIAPTTPTTETAEPIPYVRWDRLPVQESLQGGFFNAAAVTPDGLIAVGGTSDGYNGRTTPSVWLSADGREWTRISSPAFELEDETPTGAILDVVITPTRIVAVGYEGSEPLEVDAMVWISDDGTEWSRVMEDDFGGPGIQAMKAVAVIDGVLVATGADGALAGAWYSEDGISWNRATGLESSAGTILDLAVLDGQVVGIGYIDPYGDGSLGAGVPTYFGWGLADLDFAIWISSDGRSWRDLVTSGDAVLPIDPEESESALAAVLATPEGFKAIGIVDDSPSIWTSADGYEWDIVPDALPLVLGHAYPVTIHADESGFVATAYTIDSAMQPHYGRAYGWTSRDGERWLDTFDEMVVTRTIMLEAVPLGGIVDIVEFEGALIGVGHVGIYREPGELETSEFCGGGGSEAPSCRTDATVWIGTWTEGN
jgi:hypothetical protein